MPLLYIKTLKSQTFLALWNFDKKKDRPEFIFNGETIISHIPVLVKEWIYQQILMRIFKVDNIHISYNKLGRPQLSNNWHISISHSKNFITILVDKHCEVGVDIQVPKENLATLKDYFLSSEEKAESPLLWDTDRLHLCWCAKESLYKKISISTENMYTDFSVKNIQGEGATGTITVLNTIDTQDYLFSYEITSDYYLVYSID